MRISEEAQWMDKKKQIRGALFFALLIVFLTVVFSVLLYPRNNRTEEATDAISGNKLLGEKPGTIDVLFVGDSQAYASVSPMELWMQNGITSFVSGNGGQPVCEMPDLVREALKTQGIKIVVFEADTVFIDCSVSKYAYTKLKNIVPLLQYHDRWKTIGTDKFTLKRDFSETDPLKGYRFSPKTEPFYTAHPEYMGDRTAFEPIGRAAELSVRDIEKLCDEYGAKLVLLSVPNLSWTWGRHNSVSALAEELHAEFVDLNLPSDMEEIDWVNEALDYGVHMNHTGAVKTSVYLGNYLAGRYALPDHREDPAYENWRNDCKVYLSRTENTPGTENQ